MSLQISGRVAHVLPVQTGEGKNGPWKKQTIVVETDGQYPKKVCVSLWGDKFNDNLLQLGSVVTVSFDLESREHNDRWYTDVRAWRVDAGNVTNPSVDSAASAAPSMPSASAQDSFSATGNQEADDLPF